MTSSNGSIYALLAICVGISPVPGEFPAQRPVTRSLDVFFDLRLNIWLSKQWWGWWFGTLSHPLWRHRVMVYCEYCVIEWLWNLEMTYLCWFDSYDSNPVKYVLMNALNLKQLFFFSKTWFCFLMLVKINEVFLYRIIQIHWICWDHTHAFPGFFMGWVTLKMSRTIL